MQSVVLQCKGEAVHSLLLFQGYTVEDWSCVAAVHTVVGGSMGCLVGSYRTVETVPGGVGCSALHQWW